MHLFKLGCCVIILSLGYICASAPDTPEWITWTQLTNILKNPKKRKEALRNKSLPYDEDSLKVISLFIKEHAPKDQTASPCCIKKNVETDSTLELEDLIEFHKKHVSLLRKRRDSNSLSGEERNSLVTIERDIKQMPKKIRRSYEELPSLD